MLLCTNCIAQRKRQIARCTERTEVREMDAVHEMEG